MGWGSWAPQMEGGRRRGRGGGGVGGRGCGREGGEQGRGWKKGGVKGRGREGWRAGRVEGWREIDGYGGEWRKRSARDGPRTMWAFTRSLEVRAAIRDSSPASTVPATMRANRSAFLPGAVALEPATPSSSSIA